MQARLSVRTLTSSRLRPTSTRPLSRLAISSIMCHHLFLSSYHYLWYSAIIDFSYQIMHHHKHHYSHQQRHHYYYHHCIHDIERVLIYGKAIERTKCLMCTWIAVKTASAKCYRLNCGIYSRMV